MSNVIPFDPNRFSQAEYDTIKRRYTRAIAVGRVSEIEWLHEEWGDVIHLRAADGDGVCSFGKFDGKVHALDHSGLFIAEAARLDEVIERVKEWGERKVL